MTGTPRPALRSLRARRGPSPLAAEPSRPRDAGPSGKHSCLITEQECTAGSWLRHGHKLGCSQLAPRNRASRTSRGVFGPQSATLSEKVTACHPPRAPSAQNPKDTPRSSLLNAVMGVFCEVLSEIFLKDACTWDLSCVKKVLLEALR